jgi:hypothetical protein
MNFIILYNTLNEKSDLHFVRFNITNGNTFDQAGVSTFGWPFGKPFRA